MLEKIALGYKLGLIDFESVEKTGFGGEEKIYQPLVKFGGALAWIIHPIRSYNALLKEDISGFPPKL